jgi:hypothetical protein
MSRSSPYTPNANGARPHSPGGKALRQSAPLPTATSPLPTDGPLSREPEPLSSLMRNAGQLNPRPPSAGGPSPPTSSSGTGAKSPSFRTRRFTGSSSSDCQEPLSTPPAGPGTPQNLDKAFRRRSGTQDVGPPSAPALAFDSAGAAAPARSPSGGGTNRPMANTAATILASYTSGPQPGALSGSLDLAMANGGKGLRPRSSGSTASTAETAPAALGSSSGPGSKVLRNRPTNEDGGCWARKATC